jgi:hypothetical protein
LTVAEGRKFALTVGGAFLVLGGVLRWRAHGGVGTVLLGLGALFVAAGLLVPARLAPVHRIWMGLALAISRVTTPVFMGIVYFVVITPTGLLMRLFGRNPLVRGTGAGSHFVDRSPGPGRRSDLKRQF